MVQGPIRQEPRPPRPRPRNPDWYPDWRGKTCAIVASGPTAKDANLELLRDRAKVIAINNSWKLVPWADVLYACDARWWEAYKGVPEFKGLRVSQDTKVLLMKRDIKIVRSQRGRDRLITNQPGIIGWGGNSGFHCLNLAVVWGARRIILIGYDMRLDLGTHWHGLHQSMNNPTPGNVLRWCRAVDGVAEALKKMKIEVLNTSDVSSLKNYPKVSLEEAIGQRSRTVEHDGEGEGGGASPPESSALQRAPSEEGAEQR